MRVKHQRTGSAEKRLGHSRRAGLEVLKQVFRYLGCRNVSWCHDVTSGVLYLVEVCQQVSEVGLQVAQSTHTVGQNSQQPLVQPAARRHATHTDVLQGATHTSVLTGDLNTSEFQIHRKYLEHLIKTCDPPQRPREPPEPSRTFSSVPRHPQTADSPV